MTTKAQVKTQAKTPAAQRPAHFRQPSVAVTEREADRPDIATQLEGASRLGHRLGAIRVRTAAPSPIQAKPLIQRQELREEDEEELQMKREPAAIQRQKLPEDEEEELQMKPETAALQRQGRGDGLQLDDETANRINRARGGGQPLDGAIQAHMGETMGHDFSSVRVHTDSQADALNRQLSAKAFTTVRDVFFRRGAYEPGSSSGRELIAHELSHVVQQAQGRVKPTMQLEDGVPVNDDQELEHEADVMGSKALQMRPADNAPVGPIAQASALKAQDRRATQAAGVPGVAMGPFGGKGRLDFLSSSRVGVDGGPNDNAATRLETLGPSEKPPFEFPIPSHLDSPVQRQIERMNVQIEANRRNEARLDTPVHAVITHTAANNEAKSVGVTRRTRAIRSYILAGSPVVKMTSGAGVNQWCDAVPGATVENAVWQDDGPAERNVTRTGRRGEVKVEDAPGFRFAEARMKPMSFRAEFSMVATDLTDQHSKTEEFETHITEQDADRLVK